MAGVKGKSGRKSNYENMCIEEILQLSNKCVRDCLSDESIDLYKRGELGMRFIMKYMPERMDIRHQVNLTLSPDLAAELVSVTNRNMLLQNELRKLSAIEAPKTKDTEQASRPLILEARAIEPESNILPF